MGAVAKRRVTKETQLRKTVAMTIVAPITIVAVSIETEIHRNRCFGNSTYRLLGNWKSLLWKLLA